MSEQNIIKWGIIGCGDVTEIKSGPAFNKVANSQLIAVMRRDIEKAKDYATRHQLPKFYGDAYELMQDPNINAIYIATPPKFHEEYALAAMERGKYVYVEKPVTLNVNACKRIIEAVEKHNAKLVVAHYRRALPMFLHIKKLLQEEAIGKIKLINITLLQPGESNLIAQTKENWRLNPEVSGGGLFYDLAPHQLDILIHLFGKALHCNGISAHQSKLYPAEDAVCGNLLFEKDILFSGVWNFNAPAYLKEEKCKIIGEKGCIEFSFFGNEVELIIEKHKERFSFQHPEHIQQPMIEKTVSYFLDKEQNPCSIGVALHSLEVMENFVYKNCMK